MDVQNGQTLDELIEAFSQHLQRTRGMHPNERRKNARYVRAFVEHVGGGDNRLDVTVFTAPDVIAFIESLVGRYQPNRIRHFSTALRSFFRILRVQGLRDDRLDEAVPHMPISAYEAQLCGPVSAELVPQRHLPRPEDRPPLHPSGPHRGAGHLLVPHRSGFDP